MLTAVKAHWPEYLIEAWGLAMFMVSACGFGVLVFHPDSYLAEQEPLLKNALMGVAMGATAIAIFTSPWGRRSGAHINPVVTLTFFRLGKISGVDAVFYSIAQFAGATIGVLVSWLCFGSRLAASEVNFVVTVPGKLGTAAAFAGEFVIAFVMMTTVLNSGHHRTLSRFTPYLAGLLIALFIAIESPVSGMSMNPARTLGSAMFADVWTGWWIYLAAPTLAMLAAAELFLRSSAFKSVLCAKFGHSRVVRFIFRRPITGIVEAAGAQNDVTRSPLNFKSVKGLFLL